MTSSALQVISHSFSARVYGSLIAPVDTTPLVRFLGSSFSNSSIVMPDGQSGAEFGLSLSQATSPPRSGGLLAALHLWQRLLLVGPRRFGEVYYLGTVPWTSDDQLADCLVGTYGDVEARFYFAAYTGDLIGMEMQASDDPGPVRNLFRRHSAGGRAARCPSLDDSPRRRRVCGIDGELVRAIGW
jgi:hypothetical protein